VESRDSRDPSPSAGSGQDDSRNLKAKTTATAFGWLSIYDPTHRKVRDGWAPGLRCLVRQRLVCGGQEDEAALEG
jgi:hypothetical protein